MSNAWEQTENLADKHANAGRLYVRMNKDGDGIVGAFCSEPYPREVIWTGARYESFDPVHHRGKRPSLRVMINFYVPSERAMRIVEGSASWFKKVLDVRDQYDLDSWLFEIKRHGETGDIRTRYTISPKEEITDALRDEITSAELNDLAGLCGDNDEDPLIDDKTANEIVERLMGLPQTEADTFLDQFHVPCVSAMRESDMEAARLLLGALEVRLERKRPAAQVEVDPFA